jgi:hypothetical protein
MTELAQTYVHLRPYEIDAERINHLGIATQERAIAAARQFYRGNVTIDVRLEEGSARLWVTVAGVLSALNIGYGAVADYKGFKDSIVAICEDARKFGTFVSGAFSKDAAATLSQIYRIERRLKVPGKIKRIIVKLETLENAKLSETELRVQLAEVQQELRQIEKELSPQEVAGLHQVLLHFENAFPLRELPPSQRRLSLPKVAVRTEQPVPLGQELAPYTEPHHLWDVKIDVPGFQTTNLTFHRSVFVPAIGDGGSSA